MMGSHGLGHQLRAQLLDRSGGTYSVSRPRPPLLFHGLASRVQPGLTLLQVHTSGPTPVSSSGIGTAQVTYDIWQGLGPAPFTLPDSWSLWQGPSWGQLWC